jgi:hypothetical protein
LGERLLCKQEVIGSNPFTSTTVAAPLRPRDRRCASLSAKQSFACRQGASKAGARGNAESDGCAGCADGVRCSEKSEATPPGEPGGGLIEG